MRERQRTKHPEGSAGLRGGRARARFLIAFAFLVGGVIAGATWHKRDWTWAFPAGGFIAYVLAFRQALRVGRPEGIDDLWRSSSSATGAGQEQRRRGLRLGWLVRRKGEVARWDFRKGPLSGHRRYSDAVGSRRPV